MHADCKEARAQGDVVAMPMFTAAP